ncbi:MAG: sigma-54-dependent Fis family transcriptional regulator [Acidobacteria bacterium]|nr:sigma-54-dependent Fis family transcriptional regulator [Acidobacteriota bacterium]
MYIKPVHSPVKWLPHIVSRLAFSNPFSTERIQFEKTALGKEFVEGDPVWSVSVADPEAPRPNVALIHKKVEELITDWRPSDNERALYEDCVLYLLYQRYYASFAGARRDWSFFRKFLADWNRLLGPRTSMTPEHFFACSWQIMRAFHGIFDHVIGSSMPAARLRAAIWESIFTCDMKRYRGSLFAKMGDFATLITGPSGTGKELVAKAIAGARYLPFQPSKMTFEGGEAFYPVNLAALSPALIESELFGHKKGSFTGAIADRAGWLEACPRTGSVFLDEMGELELHLQVKLLRVIESREYSAVGDTARKRFEGKLIAATNRDLAVEIAAGRFREDLYYRLCADQIATPSMAAQIDDKPEVLRELIYYMTRRTVGEDADAAYPAVRDWILREMPPAYRWPGNYRELEQCVRNVLIRKSYRPLAASTMPDSFWSAFEGTALTSDEVLNHYARRVYEKTRSYSEAARIMGIDRRTVKARVDGGER